MKQVTGKWKFSETQNALFIGQAKALGISPEELVKRRVNRAKGRKLKPLEPGETLESRAARLLVMTDMEFVEIMA